MTSKIIKPVARKGLVLPEVVPVSGNRIEEISLAKAQRMGLMHPARRVNGKLIPPVPKGMGVFAKIALQVIDAKGTELLARAKSPAERARIVARHAVAFKSPKTGKMVKVHEAPCHSFNRNFGFFIRGFMQNLDSALNLNETLTDDTGATFQTREKGGSLTAATRIISTLAKIKFGSSNAALVTTQTNLQGVLLGPTTEAAVVVTLIVEDTVNTIFTVVGQITNGTGGVFTVQEMGLFPELQSQANVANNTTMMLRDLTGAVNVNNGQTIIGTYTFTIAV